MGEPLWITAHSLDDVVSAWSAGATVVGGGVALASTAFPTVRTSERMIDLRHAGLDGLELPNVGAMVSLSRLVDSPELKRHWPAVWEAAAATGHAGIRRAATVGGTVAARLPTADLLCALCAYRSYVTIWNTNGSQTIPLATALEKELDGIVAEVRLGPPAAGAYRRASARTGFAPAIAGLAGVRRDEGDELWAGAVGPKPFRIDHTSLPSETELIGDERCSAWYRRQLLSVLRDEVLEALSAADGSSH